MKFKLEWLRSTGHTCHSFRGHTWSGRTLQCCAGLSKNSPRAPGQELPSLHATPGACISFASGRCREDFLQEEREQNICPCTHACLCLEPLYPADTAWRTVLFLHCTAWPGEIKRWAISSNRKAVVTTCGTF